MGRQTSRLVADSAWLEHGLTQRTFAGSVTMTQITSTSFSGTGTSTTTQVEFAAPVAWASASVTVASANIDAAQTPVSLTVSLNGNQLAQTTGHSNTAAAASTSTASSFQTTPANAGNFTVRAQFGTSATTVSFSVTRDARVTTLSPPNP